MSPTPRLAERLPRFPDAVPGDTANSAALFAGAPLLPALNLSPTAVVDRLESHDRLCDDSVGEVLDVAHLLDMCSHNTRRGPQLLEKFLAQSALVVTELARQCAAGDAECLAVQAHALRGTAASLGAVRLAHAAARLKDAVRSDSHRDVPELLARVEYELQECHRAIGDFVDAAGDVVQTFPMDRYENLDCRR